VLMEKMMLVELYQANHISTTLLNFRKNKQ
jgi:hypothetical protein